MHTPIITIKNLTKSFPKKEGRRRVDVFRDLNITIYEGEFLILLGPSGCGKSTFLRILAGLDTATSGHIIPSAKFVPERIGFVFQNFGLLPWLTVFQNIELNLIGHGVQAADRAKRVTHTLRDFGLSEFKDHYPHALSGGMRQRVGLARAFVVKPSVIFLDEPFSELDFFTAGTLRALLTELWQKEKMTVVMVSHYIDEAVALADRIAVFSDRPSTIRAVIHNELARPRDPRSALFYKKEDEILGNFEPK